MRTHEFDMVYWITERYAIKTRREQGVSPPWTPDPIMAGVRFCNVHREDDAVTRWFRTYWNKPDDSAWKFVLGRMINYVPTLDEILLPAAGSDLPAIKAALKARRARGEKVFTSVYTISTCGKSMDKIDYVVDWVVQACMEAGDPTFESLEDAHEELTCIDGLGQFLSAQVLADMKNTVGHPLMTAPDWWSWCASGPGSIKGLQAFFPDTKVTQTTFHRQMAECRALVDPLLPTYIPRISAQDFQNVLCEFSKMMSVRKGGHVRNVYHPTI